MMTQKIILGTLLPLIAIVIFSFSDTPNPVSIDEVSHDYISVLADQQDWNSCVQKADSEWGGQCLNYGFSEAKYTVHLVNGCSEIVDLMSCVQRENGGWQCFYRLDMKKSDTLHAYACRGNGNYLKWVRKAGDITTKFPSLAEVNDEY